MSPLSTRQGRLLLVVVGLALCLPACTRAPTELGSPTTSAIVASGSSNVSVGPSVMADRSRPAPDATPSFQFQGTRRELIEKVVSCLQGRGYPVKTPLPGEYFWKAPKGVDLIGYSWAVHDCYMEVGNLPTPPLSDENLRSLYSAELKAADCVRSYGVEVPQAPSFETYARSRRESGSALWFAMMNVTPQTPNYAVIIDKCDPLLFETKQ